MKRARCTARWTLLSLAAVALPAAGGQWVVVGAEGQLPQRSVVYADFTSVTSRLPPDIALSAAKAKDPVAVLEAAKTQRVRAIEVLEAPEDPDTIQYTLEFRCATREVQIPEAISWARNAVSETQSRPNWISIPEGWIERVFTIACEQKKWEAAVKAAEKARSQQAFSELGMIYVGEHVLPTELADFTWENFWKNGKRPAYTSTRSPEEIEKRRQDVLAQLAQTQKELGAKSGALQEDLRQQESEHAFIKEVSKTFKSKSGEQQKVFYGQAGWTEAEVVDFWGPPMRVYDSDGERRLLYFAEDDSRKAVAVVGKGGQVLGVQEYGELRQCDLDFVMRKGGKKPGWRVVDYHLKGQNCKRSTLGQLVN